MNPRHEHEHLSAWLDGELSDADVADLEAELARDPELRAELQMLESVSQFVRKQGPESAPLGFHHRVMARIDEEFPEQSSRWAWLRRPFGLPLEGLVLALAAAAVLMLLMPDWRSESKDPVSDLEEKALSPAAFELPPPTPKPSATQAAERLPEPQKVEVIGRATTAERPLQKLGTSDLAAKGMAGSGTSAPVPQPVLGEDLGAISTKPVPSPKIPPGTSEPEIVPLRYVIAGTDPEMKHEILSVAARFGGARGEDGEPVRSAAMSGSSEDLIVSVRQVDLPKLTSELKKLGYSFVSVPAAELSGGEHIDVRLTLSLSEHPKAASPQPVLPGDLPEPLEE